MNYQHQHHAGSFADVLKHSILALLLEYLQKKPTGYCYIDTHAGAGHYDLSTQKTQEAQQGIQQLMSVAGTPPEFLHSYLSCVQLPHYPGSPEIALHLKRPQDRLILNEFHPAIFQQLKTHFGKTPSIALHQRDAYEFLPAIVPPKEKRGVVLIDPPFEKTTEIKDLNIALCKGIQRWRQGIYMIWTPVTSNTPHNALSLLLQNIDLDALVIDFNITAKIPNLSGLIGSQIIILNPPWQFHEAATSLTKHLWYRLNRGDGRWQVYSFQGKTA